MQKQLINLFVFLIPLWNSTLFSQKQEHWILDSINTEGASFEKLIRYESKINRSKILLIDSLKSEAHKRLALQFESKGHIRKALQNVIQALYFAKRSSFSPQSLAHLYLKKGRLENLAGHYNVSNKSLDNGIQTGQIVQDSLTLLYCYNQKGVNFMELEKYDSALLYIQLASHYAKKMGKVNMYNELKVNLSAIHLYRKEPELALNYLSEFREVAWDPENPQAPIYYQKKGYAEFLLGNYSAAIAHFDTSYLQYKRRNDLNGLISCLKDRNELFVKIGDYKSAHAALTEKIQIKNKLFSGTERDLFENWKEDFFDERERFVQREEEQLSKQKALETDRKIALAILVAAISIIILLILSFAYITYRGRSRRNAEFLKQQVERDKREAIVTKLRLENEQLAKQGLERDVMSKNNDLVDFSLELTKKVDYNKKLLQLIKSLKTLSQDELSRKINEIIAFVNYENQQDDSTNAVKEHLDVLNDRFYSILRSRHKSLSKKELELCGYYRIGMTTKEIANLKGIEPSSIKMARYRLRKKLDLPSKSDLYRYLKEIQMESESSIMLND